MRREYRGVIVRVGVFFGLEIFRGVGFSGLEVEWGGFWREVRRFSFGVRMFWV